MSATQDASMNTNAALIFAARADVSDIELRALIAATYGVPQTAPGLLAWLESAFARPLRSADLDRPELAGQRHCWLPVNRNGERARLC